MMLDHRHDNGACLGYPAGQRGYGVRRAGRASWKIAPQDIAEIVLSVLRMPARTLISRVEVRPANLRSSFAAAEGDQGGKSEAREEEGRRFGHRSRVTLSISIPLPHPKPGSGRRSPRTERQRAAMYQPVGEIVSVKFVSDR